MLIKFKRTVAFVLLLVYAPAVGFAAPNLIWCITDDGHSAVEIVSHAGQHLFDIDAHTRHMASPAPARADLDHPKDCEDQLVSSRAVQPRKPVSQLATIVGPSSDFAVTLASPSVLRTAVEPIRNGNSFCGTGLSYSPQLLQMKTVILRN